MKPINLTISAFGPYKDKVVIDFTKLGENELSDFYDSWNKISKSVNKILGSDLND